MSTKEPTSALIDFILNLPLFGSLNRMQVDVVARYVKRRNLKAGGVLFHQWDKADYVCFIEQGSLEVLKKNGPEEYQAVTTLRRGRSIGEMSVIDNFPRTATVRAYTNARVVLLTRTDFERLMVEHHDIGIEIIKGLARLMARNLHKTSSRLADNMLPMA
jgi:CRP/FNR family cyclic AMP-dependent transcriptional regulator